MRRSELGLSKLEFVPPEQNWIQNAAHNAATMKPRPQVMDLIRDFRRVSYHYAKIQAGAHGWYDDPVYELVYHCLLERLEKARLYIEDPQSELRQLEERSLRKKWPLKVYLRRRAALEMEMSGRHAQLDLKLLMNLMRKTQSFEQKKDVVQREVRRLWQKAKKRRTVKKCFPKQNQELQEQLRCIVDQSAKLRVLLWTEWLDMQALQVIYDMEKDIVRMAATGRILRDELPKGRRAIKSQTTLWKQVPVVIIAELDADLDPQKIVAVITPSEYSNKQRRRMRGKKAIYRNKSGLIRKRFR
jgi:hypothetical protein